MNISSSSPAAPGSVPAPAPADAGAGKVGIGSQGVELLESDTHESREAQTNKPDADTLLKERPAGKSPTRLTEKIEPELKDLIMTSGEKSGKFMGKMRSLARNTMKMFACTNPNQQEGAVSYSSLTPDAHLYEQKKQAATGGERQLSPYNQFAEKLTLTGADEIVTYMNLGLLDDFHNGSLEIPEISRQISEADKNGLTGQLTKSPGLLQKVLVPAGSMESISEGTSAYSIVKANPETSGKQSDLLAQHLQEAALATTNALEESYTPQNPKLRQLVDSLPEGATKLHQFGNSENNPYQALSASEHFTDADDQHLRTWLSHGLQVLDKGARIMQAVLIDRDTSLTIMGDLYQFTHLDEPGVANG